MGLGNWGGVGGGGGEVKELPQEKEEDQSQSARARELCERHAQLMAMLQAKPKSSSAKALTVDEKHQQALASVWLAAVGGFDGVDCDLLEGPLLLTDVPFVAAPVSPLPPAASWLLPGRGRGAAEP